MQKQDTILWINHAINFFKNQDKTQKEMAVLLGLEESRISEMKSGKSNMLPSTKRLINELCGTPRQEPGRWERVYISESVESFITNFDDFDLNNYLRKGLQGLKGQENKAEFLKNCTFRDSDHDVSFSDIDEFVRHDGFKDAYQECQEKLKRQHYYERQTLSVGDIAIRIDNQETFEWLEIVWLLAEKDPEFTITNIDQYNINPILQIQEVVLTGRKVLVIEKNIKPKSYSWQNVRIELYLSQNTNYHLLVHLSDRDIRAVTVDIEKYGDSALGVDECNLLVDVEDEDSLVLIENINSLDLFTTIDDVRKWCGLPRDHFTELKRRIAKYGGHIPGVRVLD